MKQIRTIWKNRSIRYAATALVVALLAVGAILIHGSIEGRSYDSYEVLKSEAKTDSVSKYEYSRAGIVRYAADGAALLGSKLNILWSTAYSMTDPQAVVCENRIMIYDRQGTGVLLFDGRKQDGGFSTSLPIIRASVSSGGNVAALLDGGEKTVMVYYSKSGSVIAEGESTMTDPGYPTALALSEDGKGLAVSYLTAADGTLGSTVRFYSFTRTGRKKENNLAGEVRFPGVIVPDLQYIGSECMIFRDNGFTVYKGIDNPREVRSEDFDEDIVSIFHNSAHVGFVFRSESREHSFRVEVYSSGGGHLSEFYIDHSYDRVHVCGSDVVFSDSTGFSVYSSSGVCRYQGKSSGGSVTDVIALGGRKLLLFTDMASELICLK